MAVGIVGDAYRHKKSIQDIRAQKNKIETAKNQHISGFKYTKARELGGQIILVNSIQTEKKLLEGYIRQNETSVTNRLRGEEEAIQSIQNEAIKFKESLVLFCDGNPGKDPSAFLIGFAQHLTTLEREGNTKVGDSYIWGGTITNEPPFDLSLIADGLDPASGVTLDYYKGNGTFVSMTTDTNNNLECEIVGKHPAFEKFIRALKIANDPSIVSGDTRVTTAQTLVDEAIIELGDLLAQVGAKEAALETLIESQDDRVLYLSEAFNKLVESSAEETATIFMQEHAILETAYAMLSRMSKMSLSEYL